MRMSRSCEADAAAQSVEQQPSRLQKLFVCSLPELFGPFASSLLEPSLHPGLETPGTKPPKAPTLKQSASNRGYPRAQAAVKYH